MRTSPLSGLRAAGKHEEDANTNALVARWQEEADSRARDELIARFLPLARKLASRYANPHEPLEDLVQVASVGLVQAIDRFDPGRGVRFQAFAVPTILGELKRHFRNTAWSVHVPRAAQEMALKVDRAARQIMAQTGRSPRIDELAQYLEISAEDVVAAIDAGKARYSMSLDGPVAGSGDEEPESVGDRIGCDDERYGLVTTAMSLRAALVHLPYMQRRALALRVTRDLSQVEIARELGCSQMQVSRLLRRATARLRVLTDPELDSPARGCE
jgi:RNA polymerase sigma-B factor